MSSKKRPRSPAAQSAASARAAAPAPPAAEAMAALTRRGARAVVFLFVRLVAVALFVTLVESQSPRMGRAARLLLEAAASLLVVLPFFTALGRIFGWRIALGRVYAQEERWAEAAHVLSVFARRGYHPFDARGEGAYWLALALRARGDTDEAQRLFRSVAETRAGEWRDRARAELDRDSA